MFQRLLIKAQSSNKYRYDLSEDLRPFGWPFFPEEVSDQRIVLKTTSSSDVVVLKSGLLLFVILVGILCYIRPHFEGLLLLVVAVGLLVFPFGAPEKIVISPSGILFKRHVFLFAWDRTVSKTEIQRIMLEQRTWGLKHVASFKVVLTRPKTLNLFSIIRNSHDHLIEDSSIVIQKVSTLLGVPSL